ncbi:MAG: CPBP family intramembrane metalloprotease [Sedimentisphaerales bacterium]|nr:CPBP family intramembrane metalloprotease [Sedimentisphaerales bacterium]
MSERLVEYFSLEHIICYVGVVIYGIWLLRTSLGTKALSDSSVRRNNMPVWLAFVPLLIWFGIVGILAHLREKLLPELADWHGVFSDNLLLCVGAIAGGIVTIILARESFAQRLKGFGFDLRTVWKDLWAAILNLLGIWPIVMAMIVLMMLLGKLIYGPGYEIQQHQELEFIIEYPQLPVRIVIIVAAVFVVPVFEEMLFRGLFQSMIRSVLEVRWPLLGSGPKAWVAIAFSSALFAMVHANPTHWPALFALAMCLGYSYEKSGSLFRPIFIHSLFNGVSLLAALNQ